jgi:triosephosphate isomerase
LFHAEGGQLVESEYGGPTQPDTAEELLKEDDIDGALTGGASLKAASIHEIIKIVHLLSAYMVCPI